MIGLAKMSTPRRSLPQARASLGVLSLHLDGEPCRVNCEFCYLAGRAAVDGTAKRALDPTLIAELLATLDYAEVAVAVSEPGGDAIAPMRAIVAAATARKKPVAITTTAAVLAAVPELIDGVRRVNLSIDPRKGSISPRLIGSSARAIRSVDREVVLIVSLISPEFAEVLIGGGLLSALVALPDVDKVALNALKPPPPWCDRAFWLRTCARLAPLLERHLDRRLFLDCYVAARILSLGGCPARPDVSPGPEFRSCVYQPFPDARFTSARELAQRLERFVAPTICPFPID